MLVFVTTVTTSMAEPKACAVEFWHADITADKITALVILSVVMSSCQNSTAKSVDGKCDKADSSGTDTHKHPRRP